MTVEHYKKFKKENYDNLEVVFVKNNFDFEPDGDHHTLCKV